MTATTTAEMTRTFTAAELFGFVYHYLDGAGISCTDPRPLAEEIAASFGCDPQDVDPLYRPDTTEDDE